MSNNNIHLLPDSIFNLHNLEELHIAFNHLESISEDIEALNHLRVLNLFNNKLKILPRNITKLKTLRKLNISFNNISKLPKVIYTLENLEVILLDNLEFKCS